MIWQPKKYQVARIHYRKSARHLPYHGRHCMVLCAAKGPGPRNVLVRLTGESIVVVPRGNLVAE